LIDWGQVWNTFRSGIGIGFLVAVGLTVFFVIYYGFIGSSGKARIARAKIHARQMIEAGKTPYERTFDYVYYMLSRVPNDLEARGLLAQLDRLKSGEKIEKAA